MTTVKLLVIDDEPNVRDIIRYGLQQSFPSMVIDESSNGRQAKEELERKNYDLVVCDWEIPFIKGDELLQWLREHPALHATPFIMLSAKNEGPQIMRALQLGANSYVVKPFTIAGLVQKISAIIGGKLSNSLK